MVRTPGKTVIAEGEHVHLRLPVGMLHLFDADGDRIREKDEAAG
jgi:hypothetical protein